MYLVLVLKPKVPLKKKLEMPLKAPSRRNEKRLIKGSPEYNARKEQLDRELDDYQSQFNSVMKLRRVINDFRKQNDELERKIEQLERDVKISRGPGYPQSAYLLYVNQRRAEPKESHLYLAAIDRLEVIRSEWKAMSDDEKKPYIELAKLNALEYRDFKQRHPK